MIRGLYIANTGMNVQTKRMDIISNDLANVNTAGYKKDTAVVSSFPEILTARIEDMQNHVPNDAHIGTMTFGAKVDGVYTQFVQGSVMNTGSPTNMAIQGNGFFSISTPNGTKYTRDGSFSINQAGNLVTQEGHPVLGQRGVISLGEEYLQSGSELQIKTNGEVMINGEVVDKLSIVAFADNQSLTKLEDNLYEGGGGTVAFEGTVLQGFLETSNVNPVTAMVDMITVSRAYEANQKMIQVHDNLLGKAVNELGRA